MSGFYVFGTEVYYLDDKTERKLVKSIVGSVMSSYTARRYEQTREARAARSTQN